MPAHRKVSLCLFSAMAVLGASAAHAQGALRKVVVFGDSLSDNGNLHSLTLGVVPASPYWQGRFSNGRVWIEQFAQDQGLVLSDWAYGGAKTSTWFPVSVPPSMWQEVKSYVNQVTDDPNSTLFAIWISANNYLDGSTDVNGAIGDIIKALDHLNSRKGAKHFLIPNLPDLGAVPGASGRKLSPAELSRVSRQHNATLASRLQSWKQSHGGSTVTLLDIAARFQELQVQGASYGFSNTSQACWTGGYSSISSLEEDQLELSPLQVQWNLKKDLRLLRAGGLSDAEERAIRQRVAQSLAQSIPGYAPAGEWGAEASVCSDVSGRLFWDGVHPTQKGHCWVSWAASNALQSTGFPMRVLGFSQQKQVCDGR